MIQAIAQGRARTDLLSIAAAAFIGLGLIFAAGFSHA